MFDGWARDVHFVNCKIRMANLTAHHPCILLAGLVDLPKIGGYERWMLHGASRSLSEASVQPRSWEGPNGGRHHCSCTLWLVVLVRDDWMAEEISYPVSVKSRHCGRIHDKVLLTESMSIEQTSGHSIHDTNDISLAKSFSNSKTAPSPDQHPRQVFEKASIPSSSM